MADDSSTTAPPASTSTSDMIYYIIRWLLTILLSISAAILAYRRNGSAFLTSIAFIFAPIYLPYYAFTEPGPGSSSMMGAARYLRKMF
jgi:hypothetical protein